MLAVVLALGTAITYGVANYVGPILGRRAPVGGVLLVSQLAALTVAAVVAAAYHPGKDDLTGLVIGLVAGTMNAATLGFFYLAAQEGDLAVVAPIGSIGTVVPVVVGLVQGDRPGATAYAGVPLALVGVVLAARAEAEELEQHDLHPGMAPAKVHDRRRLSIAYAVLSALTGGVFLTLSAHAAGHGASWAVLWSRVSLVVCTGVAILLLRVRVRMPAATTVRAAVPGLLLVTGTSLFAVASTHGQLAVVSVLASVSPVVTVAMALVLLKERLRPIQWVGVVGALAGVVLTAAG